MSVEVNVPEVPNWIVTFGSSLVAGISGFVFALINRGPAMQQAWIAANKNLIDGYNSRVADLVAEVHSLRKEVVDLRVALDATTKELHEVRTTQGFGA